MPPPETCAACLREVRWGTRGGRLAWWHRDDVPDTAITRTARHGHEPVLGHASFDTDWDAVEVARAAYAVNENETEDNRIFEIPPVEVTATGIVVGDPRMPGGAKNLINAVHKVGGTTRATYSRAPKVHAAHGNFLGMVDYVVVKFEVKDPNSIFVRTGVARWADGSLDVSYITDYDQSTKTVTPTRVDSKPLRDWLVKAERSDNGIRT